MFRKLHQAKRLKVRAYPQLIAVGFFGRVARIARVHQEGLTDVVSKNGRRITYEKRQLLGFTPQISGKYAASSLITLPTPSKA